MAFNCMSAALLAGPKPKQVFMVSDSQIDQLIKPAQGIYGLEKPTRL